MTPRANGGTSPVSDVEDATIGDLKATLEGASLMLRSECWSSDANEAVYEFPS